MGLRQIIDWTKLSFYSTLLIPLATGGWNLDIAIRAKSIGLTEALDDHCRRRLAFALGRFRARIGTVTVVLADVNGPRGGIDKCCSIRVSLRYGGFVVISANDASMYAAVDAAADRICRALKRELEKARRCGTASIRHATPYQLRSA